MVIIGICSLKQEKSVSLIPIIKMSTLIKFPSQFCLGSISEIFDKYESTEAKFEGNVYDFSPD